MKRSVDYVLKGAGGNPFDIAYRPEWEGALEFTWQSKRYRYQGEAQVFVLAISPDNQPVLVAEPDDGVWRGKNNYLSCSTPTYVQLAPDVSGKNWHWPPAVENWLFGLPANLMRHRPLPENKGQRYSIKDREREDASAWIQFPPTARISATYKSTGYCKGKS